MGFQARMLARIPSWPAVLPSSRTTRHSCTGKQAFHCEHLTAEAFKTLKEGTRAFARSSYTKSIA